MELETLYTEEQIRSRVAELAAEIDADYAGESVHLVGVLKGSLHFLSDLTRSLKTENTFDLIQVSSYGSGKSSSGVVQIRKDLDQSIENRHVLIVEDIVDTGLTLMHLREWFSVRRPKSLKVVSLLSKPSARLYHSDVEYIGFEIPDSFVVGYGLDYAERYRNLPFIAILR